MKRSTLLGLVAAFAFVASAAADTFPTPGGGAPGAVQECMTSTGKFAPCELSDLYPNVTRPYAPASAEQRGMVVTISPSSGAPGQYPAGAIPITGNSTGTTGAVVGTLAAAVAKRTYICGFDVSGIGGTAALGPVTVAGLVGSSMVYQLSSTAAGITLSRTFTPCIPASANNTAITITTTADGTATAVDVNSWGFQQ